MVAISLHLLWLISNTTKRPTTSEFLQLFRTSAKVFQSAFLATLYHAFRDAPHSLCLAAASRIVLRLTIRMRNLRITRSQCQGGNFGSIRSLRPCGLRESPPRRALPNPAKIASFPHLYRG